MLSRDCDGCSQLKACSVRYRKVTKDGKVYCPDGTAHLVDEEIKIQSTNIIERQIELY